MCFCVHKSGYKKDIDFVTAVGYPLLVSGVLREQLPPSSLPILKPAYLSRQCVKMGMCGGIITLLTQKQACASGRP